MSTAPLQVSIVIPAFNEEAAVGAEVRNVRKTLQQAGIEHEIIVVDDGSQDRTAEEAVRAGARVLKSLMNRGYGASLKTGITAAKYDMICITDADGTYPADQIPALLEQLRTADMVVGARVGQNVNIPLVRKPAKLMLGWLAERIAGRKIPDLNSGLRAFRRELAMQYFSVLSNKFSFTTTITLSMLCSNLRVIYTPIHYAKRVGQSSMRPTAFFTFILLVLRIIVFFQPLRVFMPLGGILFALGMAKALYDITKMNLSESAIFGILAALVVWSLGLVADMISRLHLRPRPHGE